MLQFKRHWYKRTQFVKVYTVKSWLIGKDSDAGRDWGQEEKGTKEDEIAGWLHWLDGHEFEWTPGVGDGQGGLACCDAWGRKESDTTERLNWIEHLCYCPICSKNGGHNEPQLFHSCWIFNFFNLQGYLMMIL